MCLSADELAMIAISFHPQVLQVINFHLRLSYLVTRFIDIQDAKKTPKKQQSAGPAHREGTKGTETARQTEIHHKTLTIQITTKSVKQYHPHPCQTYILCRHYRCIKMDADIGGIKADLEIPVVNAMPLTVHTVCSIVEGSINWFDW